MTQKPIVIDDIKGYEGIHIAQTLLSIYVRLDKTKWDVKTDGDDYDVLHIFPKKEVKQ